MIWLLSRLVVWPTKTAAYSAAAGYKTGRLLGYRRLTVFGIGVLTGVLVSNKELRDRIVEKASRGGAIAELPPVTPTSVPTTPSPTAAAEVVDLTE